MSGLVTRSKSVRNSAKVSEPNLENTKPTKVKLRPKSSVRVLAKRVTTSSSSDENESISPNLESIGIKDRVGLAKRALHTSLPSELPCRQVQIKFIYNFLSSHFQEKKGGGLYISGSPGTGKTAVINHVLEKLKSEFSPGEVLGFVSVFINCMNVGSATTIFDQIGNTLGVKAKGDELREKITNRFASKRGKMILLVLDEMDQLVNSRGNDFLYKIFEMTQLPGSKLIVVGIANSLDLTTRYLPYLNTTISPVSSKGKRRISSMIEPDQPVEVLHFTPYERDEIAQILETRLKTVEGLFDPAALKLVAAKVASSTGDMRKALNACKTAVDQMEKEGRVVLKATADDGFNSSSPKKLRLAGGDEKISFGSIAKVLKFEKDEGDLPIQQLLLLATLLRIHRQLASTCSSVPPILLSSIYEEYGSLSQWKGFEYIDMSDIVSIFTMLSDRSLVSFATSTNGTPSSRKGLKGTSKRTQGVEAVTCDPQKLERLLKDSDLFDSIVYS